MTSTKIRALSDRILQERMVCAHTNLTTFGAVVAVLEGGCVYGGLDSDKAANRLIRAANAEMQRLVAIYDDCREEIARRRNKEA